ncbi:MULTISPECIES: TonB-dependent receptor [Niastella]|uniref:Outer membrane protein beta-barrel domain-containing protein n=1 Tax=Niastella soli TaxID=2821487 RepID=A0ABS3YYQ4_9BACT|nr:hypothetical protein [Niastella soli]MBO9203061.1 hypothetical protein [Niastella soli]
MAFATVKFKTTVSGTANFYCITSANGFYELTINNNKDTKGIIEVSAIGFEVKQLVLENLSNGSLNLPIILSPLDHALPGVIIKSEPAIQVKGDTISFRAEAFKQGNERSIASLLSNMPGFTVTENGRILFNGQAIDRILIEGDDLTGKQYEQLTKTLGINGIDKFQVINNYIDPENITASIYNAKSQVLNIKYKKNFLSKTFGNIEANGGYPLKNYYLNGQIISLLSKAKFITTGNYNTTGHLPANIQQPANDNLFKNSDDFLDLSLLGFSPVARISDIKSNYQNDLMIASNRSLQTGFNGFFKIGNRFTIKTNSNFVDNQFVQSGLTVRNILTVPQPLTITQSQQILKHNNLLNNKISINYRDGKNNQLVLLLNNQYEDALHENNSTLLFKEFQDTLNGFGSQFGLKLSYNHINLNNSAIRANFEYHSLHAPYAYSQFPSNFDGFFKKGSNATAISQNEKHDDSYWRGTLAYLLKYKKHAVSIEAGFNKQQAKFDNNINLQNAVGQVDLVRSDSVNNILYDQTNINLKVRDVFTINRLLTLVAEGSVLYLINEKGNKYNGKNNDRFHRMYFLPALSANMQLNKFNKLNFSFSARNIASSIQDISDGFTINGLTRVSKGSAAIGSSTAYTGNLIYSFIDLIGQKLLFFSGIVYQKLPDLYLYNQLPDPYYTLAYKIPSSTTTTTTSFFSRADKYLFDMKIKISPQLSFSTGITNSMLNYEKRKNRFNQLKTSCEMAFNFAPFNIKGGVDYAFSWQKNNSSTQEQLKNSILKWNMDITWKISPAVLFNTRIDANNVNPSGQRASSFLLTSAELNIHSKNNRFQWGARCKNLLNQKHYTYSSILPTETVVERYQLLPLMVMGFIGLQF